jgi:hypothetical protein
MRRTLALTAALVTTGALAIGASAADTQPTARIAAKKITRDGVGQVKLGMTFREAREQHLIGKLRPGCELSGPEAHSARLRSPLRGFVDLTLTTPRKIANIAVTRGARARGVKVGDRIRDIKDASPGAIVNKRTEEIFGLWLVRVPKSAGGRITFSVPVSTKRIDMIGVPFIPFCE